MTAAGSMFRSWRALVLVANRTAKCFSHTAKNTLKDKERGGLAAESRDAPRIKISNDGGRVRVFGPEFDGRFGWVSRVCARDFDPGGEREGRREGGSDRQRLLVNLGTTRNTSSTQ